MISINKKHRNKIYTDIDILPKLVQDIISEISLSSDRIAPDVTHM